MAHFSLSDRVRWSDCDPLGIIHYRTYLRLFEVAEHEMFRSLGIKIVEHEPDGSTYFWIARTVTRDKGGFHAPRSVVAIAMGCEAARAGELVYADGVALDSPGAVVPVGITCRACERMDCEQRAFPPLQHPLVVNPHVRGVSFYAPPHG